MARRQSQAQTLLRIAAAGALLLAARAIPAHIPFDDADAFKPMGLAFNVTLTNYGGPYDGVPADAARSGAGRLFGVKDGGCGYYDVPANDFPWLSAVAFDPACPGIQGLPSFTCGSCWRFTCPGGARGCTSETRSVVVTVTDICPGCAARFGSACHADMHFSAFEKIAHVHADGGGLAANVMAERVECRTGHSLTLRIMDNQGPWQWLRVLVWRADGAGTIQKLRLLCGESKRNDVPGDIAFTKLWGATWELQRQPWGQLCAFEATDDQGNTLTSGKIDLSKYRGHNVNADIELDIQFETSSASSSYGTRSVGDGGSGSSDEQPSAPPAAPACDDVPPTNGAGVVEFTCQQQAGWGKCGAPFMAGKCNASCGRCAVASG